MSRAETERQIKNILDRYSNRPSHCEDCHKSAVTGRYLKEKVAARVGRHKGDPHQSNLTPIDEGLDKSLVWVCQGCKRKRLNPAVVP